MHIVSKNAIVRKHTVYVASMQWGTFSKNVNVTRSQTAEEALSKAN